LTVFYQIQLHGLRRARPAPRQGCEIARNSHPLRWVFAVNRIPSLKFGIPSGRRGRW
jgi:hypothetical protein